MHSAVLIFPISIAFLSDRLTYPFRKCRKKVFKSYRFLTIYHFIHIFKCELRVLNFCFPPTSFILPLIIITFKVVARKAEIALVLNKSFQAFLLIEWEFFFFLCK